MTEHRSSRRRFLQAAIAFTALPLFARLITQPAQAAALAKLPLDNPQAKALGYVEDAGKAKNTAFKPGSSCSNCQFHNAATGGCALFAGFAVSPKGWCSAWAKKA